MVMLTDLAAVLRAAGLKVVEVPDWQTRARPASTGGFAPRGNLWHHTGAKDTNPLSITDDREYAEWLAEIGRSDLPAPLCQVSIGRDGTCYVCAAGRGNHAGKAKASGPVHAGDGNELYLGWECQNTGTEGWGKPQYDAMVTAAAATSLAYGWAAVANRGHKETSVTGKWDPGALDMTRFRADVARAMRELEDDMAYTDEDRQRDEAYIAQQKRRADRTLKFEKTVLRALAADEKDREKIKADLVRLFTELDGDEA